MSPPTEPIARWSIPRIDGDAAQLEALPGGLTVVVGPNGSGKSALANWLYRTNAAKVQRFLPAHRQVWFSRGGSNLSTAQREQHEDQLTRQLSREDARWVDILSTARTDITLYDLAALTARLNADVIDRIRSGSDPSEAVAKLDEASPVVRLNRILVNSDMAVTIDINASGSIDAVRSSGERYPIAQMSDGERAAVLLSADVLMAKPDSIQLIDEPERHLHRSISVRLISELLRDRPDCHFIIVTHDVDLAVDLTRQASKVVVLHDVEWQGSGASARAWNFSEVEESASLPEDLRRAVLGGRREILFVEGADESLDRRLLEAIHPEWLVIPTGGSREVIRTVRALRKTDELHWLNVRGLIDRDRRTGDEIKELQRDGIAVLQVHEVENLFFTREVVVTAAGVQGDTLGCSPESLVDAAMDEALRALEDPAVVDHMARLIATERLRSVVLRQLPNAAAVGEGEAYSLTLPYEVEAERQNINRLLISRDYDAVVKELPIRDSSFRDRVAAALRFRNREAYEDFAITHVRRSAEMKAHFEGLLGIHRDRAEEQP